ncbi:NepR family anti-sigma factor [Hyphomonas sp.]
MKRRGAKIGDQLRRIYEDVAKEEVPDEFLKLLEEADKKKSSKPSASDE